MSKYGASGSSAYAVRKYELNTALSQGKRKLRSPRECSIDVDMREPGTRDSAGNGVETRFPSRSVQGSRITVSVALC